MDWLAPEIVTPSAALPVPLSLVREWLRESSTQDAYIEPLLRAAQSHVERLTSTYLTPVTVDLRADGFPIGRYFELPRGPVTSVTSIKYRDSADTLVTWDSANYRVVPNGLGSVVELKDTASWPDAIYAIGAVEVRAVVGYADWNAVPRDVQTALMMLVASFWADREAGAVPAAVADLLVNNKLRFL